MAGSLEEFQYLRLSNQVRFHRKRSLDCILYIAEEKLQLRQNMQIDECCNTWV